MSTFIEHMYFVNIVMMCIVCFRGPLGRMAILAKSVHLLKCGINKINYSKMQSG